MDQAKTWDEFREACTYFNIPGENMVWADKYGDIGWQAVGIAPIRKTHSGMVPVSGDGSNMWEEYLPIIEKPNLYNPEIGYISTANQNVTPEDYNKWEAIGFDWADPYRGDRINRVLESKEKFNLKEMLDLQVDYYSIPSEQIINLSSGLISNNMEYFSMLEKWDKKLSKSSYEIYCKTLKPIKKISTKEFPGYPTDLQAQLIATQLKSGLKSKVVENIFENRFIHIPELRRFGANLSIKGKTVTIDKTSNLLGAEVMATDIRASFSLIIAAMMSKGKTVINRIYHLDRGYEDFDLKLKKCGVNISRKK